MKETSVFKKYRAKLVFEAVVRSLLIAMIFGFVAGGVPAVIAKLNKFNGLWISLGVFAAVTIITTLCLYFFKFRPTAKDICKRVDRLGMEERLVTMYELQNDTSYIAMVQREDAERSSKHITKKMKLSVFNLRTLLALLVVAACSVSMMTVSADVPERKSWTQPDDYIPNPYDFVIVNYVAASVVWVEQDSGSIFTPNTFTEELVFENIGGGIILGDSIQRIVIGGNTQPVIAQADPGYGFLGWSDQLISYERSEVGVVYDLTIYAMFMKVEEDGGNGDGGSGGGSGGEPLEDEREKSGNQVIDGKTYYGDLFEASFEQMVTDLTTSDFSDDVRSMSQAYKDMLDIGREKATNP